MEGAVKDVDVEAFVKLKFEKGFAGAAAPTAPPRDGVGVDDDEAEAEVTAVCGFFHLLLDKLKGLRERRFK